eukprot:scaffold22065_cov64-Phaeocystis_antarctica.AAC.7
MSTFVPGGRRRASRKKSMATARSASSAHAASSSASASRSPWPSALAWKASSISEGISATAGSGGSIWRPLSSVKPPRVRPQSSPRVTAVRTRACRRSSLEALASLPPSISRRTPRKPAGGAPAPLSSLAFRRAVKTLHTASTLLEPLNGFVNGCAAAHAGLTVRATVSLRHQHPLLRRRIVAALMDAMGAE